MTRSKKEVPMIRIKPDEIQVTEVMCLLSKFTIAEVSNLTGLEYGIVEEIINELMKKRFLTKAVALAKPPRQYYILREEGRQKLKEEVENFRRRRNGNETYLKMCQSADELQENWKPEVGDWGVDKENGIAVICVTKDPDCFYLARKDASDLSGIYQQHISKLYWVPRMDQMQRILMDGTSYKSIHQVEVEFHNFCRWLGKWNFSYLEELWLDFLMYRKFLKLWDKKKKCWVAQYDT